MTNYIGDIRMFAGLFAPAGWAFCQGQQLLISENEPLFQLIGTTYGGDGETTFNLPNLMGRVPINKGQGPGLSSRLLAESGGQSDVVLTTATMAPHRHEIKVSQSDGLSRGPSGRSLASDPVGLPYAPPRKLSGSMSAASFETTGLGAPHENRPPFLCVNFIIALFGQFPLP